MDVDGRCETCKWWGSGFTYPNGWGPVLDEPDASGHRVCARTVTHGEFTDAPFSVTDVAEMLAYAEDYDAHARGLWTLPAFGCVLWEPKP